MKRNELFTQLIKLAANSLIESGHLQPFDARKDDYSYKGLPYPAREEVHTFATLAGQECIIGLTNDFDGESAIVVWYGFNKEIWNRAWPREPFDEWVGELIHDPFFLLREKSVRPVLAITHAFFNRDKYPSLATHREGNKYLVDNIGFMSHKGRELLLNAGIDDVECRGYMPAPKSSAKPDDLRKFKAAVDTYRANQNA